MTFHFHLQATEKEINRIALYTRMLQGESDYVKDHTFRSWVLEPNLPDLQSVLAFIDLLEAQCPGCQKLRGIHRAIERYKHPKPWKTNHDMLLAKLSRVRRTCCGNHDTGSFAFRDREKTWKYDEQLVTRHDDVVARLKPQYEFTKLSRRAQLV